MFRSLAISASGLSAQRTRMETIASNIANAETTHDVNGGPYKRRVTVMAAGDSGVAGGDAVAPGQPVGGPGPFNGVPPFAVPSMSDAPQTFQVPVLETNGPDNGGAYLDVSATTRTTSVGVSEAA